MPRRFQEVPPHVIAARRAAARELLGERHGRTQCTPQTSRAGAARRLEPQAAKTKRNAPAEIRLEPQFYIDGMADNAKNPIPAALWSRRVNIYSDVIALGVPSAPSAESVFKALGESIEIRHDGKSVGLLVDMLLDSREGGGVASGAVRLTERGKQAVRAALPGFAMLVPVLSEGTIAYVDLDAPPTTPENAARAKAVRRERLGSDNAANLLDRLGWR